METGRSALRKQSEGGPRYTYLILVECFYSHVWECLAGKSPRDIVNRPQICSRGFFPDLHSNNLSWNIDFRVVQNLRFINKRPPFFGEETGERKWRSS